MHMFVDKSWGVRFRVEKLSGDETQWWEFMTPRCLGLFETIECFFRRPNICWILLVNETRRRLCREHISNQTPVKKGPVHIQLTQWPTFGESKTSVLWYIVNARPSLKNFDNMRGLVARSIVPSEFFWMRKALHPTKFWEAWDATSSQVSLRASASNSSDVVYLRGFVVGVRNIDNLCQEGFYLFIYLFPYAYLRAYIKNNTKKPLKS